MAIASLVLGICSIVLCLGPLAGIPAVIMGHKANSDIRKSGGLLGGTGMAAAGLVTGYFSLMIFMVGFMAAITIPNLVKARRQAQLIACKNNLAIIQTAKEAWARDNGKPDDAVPVDADLLGAPKHLPEMRQCPAFGSYDLNSVKDEPTCTVHGSVSKPTLRPTPP
jgi:hypothetical protein